jgi:hypothetical protein
MRTDARQAWIDWWNGHADEMNDPDLPAALLGPWAKLKSYAARLALVVHLLRLVCEETPYEQHIDLESMQRADLVTNKVAGIRKSSEAVQVLKSLVDRALGRLETRTAANGRKVDHFVTSKGEQWDERDNPS